MGAVSLLRYWWIYYVDNISNYIRKWQIININLVLSENQVFMVDDILYNTLPSVMYDRASFDSFILSIHHTTSILFISIWITNLNRNRNSLYLKTCISDFSCVINISLYMQIHSSRSHFVQLDRRKKLCNIVWITR